LAELPPGHPWRRELVRRAAYQLARRGDLRGAASLLEQELVTSRTDSGSLALELARVRYAQGSLDEAERWYAKVPRDSSGYLSAQEELLWVRLRQGNTARVRGALESLSLSLFDDRLAPEVYAVRAISNLKLCYYGEAEKDFRSFLERNRQWAQKIQSATVAAVPPAPPEPDWYSHLLERAVSARAKERERIKSLIQDSITASLPAVGRQKHWRDAAERVEIALLRLHKAQDGEYRRQWKNAGVAVREAIRKMRFVKLELMSQLHQGLSPQPDSARAEEGRRKALASIQEESSSRLSYPFDGVVWPDELFKLRSTASNQCL
jgi:tetratricopeptide (TPR) repeat protein